MTLVSKLDFSFARVMSATTNVCSVYAIYNSVMSHIIK